MAWYGNHVDASKKLEQLIEQSPSLQQLLNYPDFIQQLKAYNPKLLEYLTNSNTIIIDLINYISVPPKENETQQRKYKLPTLSIQMIESEAISILNSFFKQDPKKKQKYLLTMFDQLLKTSNKVDGQILPILAGYFLRANICLLNNKYKETVDCLYQNQKNFEILLQNCQNLSVTNTLQVYLNLDLTKNSQTFPQRLNTKISIINTIVNIIEQNIQLQKKITLKSQSQQYFCSIKVQNLSSVLIELLEKYYLIADGKQMVDQILYQQNNIKILFKNIFDKNSQISLSLLNILISIIKFYSFSSFNSQDWNNPDQNLKNQEKLQNQLAVATLIQNLPILITELGKCQKFTIYYSKIVELINVSLTLNSHKIFNCVKNCKYIQTLIDLMFRFQYCSILEMMIQKLFLFVFRTQRSLNEEIKHFLFCQAKIIDLTAGRYLSLFQSDQQIAYSMNYNFRRKGYFGHLMKIMKIYSGIQTTDQDIINAIKNKSEIWNKISRLILKPFEGINFKQLGTYENISETLPNDYTVTNIVGTNNSTIRSESQNNKVIDQINREQAIQNLKTLQTNLMPQNKIETQTFYHLAHKEEQVGLNTTKNNDDQQFFNPPTQNIAQKLQLPNSNVMGDKKNSDSYKSEGQSSLNDEKLQGSPRLEKKSESYNDFLQRQKMKAESQIKKQRSRSKQRALSKGKTKITSPSPTKRVNKWAQGGQQKNQQKQKISLTSSSRPAVQNKNLPKIPMQHKKGLNISSTSSGENFKEQVVIQNKSTQFQKKTSIETQNAKKIQNKSLMNLQELKKVKIIYQFQVPTKKEYRKITQEDKAIFDLIGITY